MAEIKDILINARKAKGLTQEQMAGKLGLSSRMYQRYEEGSFPKYKTEVIAEIDKILGTGLHDMIYDKNAPREKSNIDEKQEPYLTKRKDKKNQPRKIPFYDAPAAAGMTETEMTPIHAPAGTIDVGDLLHDSQAAIRIYGNSMIPNYPPGCVVGLSRCQSKFIEPGEVYVIETRDRRMLKRLFYKDDSADGDLLTCYSDNLMVFDGGARNGKLAYPPFDLPKKEIINLFTVTGVIKRNANSVIINRK